MSPFISILKEERNFNSRWKLFKKPVCE